MLLRGRRICGLLVVICGLCVIQRADGEHSQVLSRQNVDLKQPYLRLRGGGGGCFGCFGGKQREATTEACSMSLTVHYQANQTDSCTYNVAVAGSGALGDWDLNKAILMNDCGGGRYVFQ
jgi:hypothetical protein